MSECDHGNDRNYDEAPPRPKQRSVVWQFFEKLNQFRIRCYLCQHEQNYQGTTGNILRHLKSKHDVDLTLKGQQDPENQERIKKLCSVAGAVSGKEVNIERYPARNLSKRASKRKQSFDDGCEVKQHQKDDDHGIYPLETYVISEEPFYMNEDSMATNDGETFMVRLKKTRTELEHARIKAETKYLSERAGYYKLLKHLTVLQAKKDKIERELCMTNSDNKIV